MSKEGGLLEEDIGRQSLKEAREGLQVVAGWPSW